MRKISTRFALYEILCLFVCSTLLLGCTGESSSFAKTPDEQSFLEESVVTFMLNYIMENEILATIELIKQINDPIINHPPEAFIIIWSSLNESRSEDPYTWLDTQNPKLVWIYKNGSLSLQENKRKEIENYLNQYIKSSSRYPGIFTWGYNEFGILSITFDKAEVYLAATCGSSCGHGVVFTLSKGENYNWKIDDVKVMWGS